MPFPFSVVQVDSAFCRRSMLCKTTRFSIWKIFTGGKCPDRSC